MAILGTPFYLLFFLLMLLLILLLLACKPWRYFSSSPSLSFFSSSITRIRTPLKDLSSSIFAQDEDLERPLVSDVVDSVSNQTDQSERNIDLEGVTIQTEGHFTSPQSHGLIYKQKLPSPGPHCSQGGSLVLDVITDSEEDVLVGQTLKRPFLANRSAEEQRYDNRVDSSNHRCDSDNDHSQEFVSKDSVRQGSNLTLEVISGPSHGLSFSVTNTSKLPLTVGRVSPSDVLLKDAEVSGKHASINWNVNKLKWELVDMGSLNGTLLNSQVVRHSDSGSRQWSDAFELASGDIITLGTSSKISVKIMSTTEHQIPFGVGLASDAMALRRGGKKLPMEDVCYYQWPLSGIDQFGLFGICDGHGGAGAAKYASQIFPEKVADLLSDSQKRNRIISVGDASDVLKDAFHQTEACMNHNYEGCTATLLLVWTDGHENYFAQCANVGDSACVMNLGEKLVKMTEDHRITSHSERERIKETGEALKDGETRLCGLNLARMLGDKFLKQQDRRFSSEPYISQVVRIDRKGCDFALMASDGLWDVIGIKKAIQLILQARERYIDGENSAEKIANYLLTEARTLRTKDNTSIIYLDFNRNRNMSCKLHS